MAEYEAASPFVNKPAACSTYTQRTMIQIEDVIAIPL